MGFYFNYLQALFNFLGLVLFNAFPERPKLKGSPLLVPFICVRVVTRGDFPDLVRRNIQRNIATCQRVGLEKFMMEVVTDKFIDLPENQRIRQVRIYCFFHLASVLEFKNVPCHSLCLISRQIWGIVAFIEFFLCHFILEI